MHAFGFTTRGEPENDPEPCQIGESEQAGQVAGFRDPLSKLAQLAKNASSAEPSPSVTRIRGRPYVFVDALDVRSFRCKRRERAERRHLSGLTALRRLQPSGVRKERAFVDGLANVPNATLSAHFSSVRVREAFANAMALPESVRSGHPTSSREKFLADATTVKMDKFNFSPDNSTLTLTAPSMSI
jgi:hypothetical protein